MKALEKDRTRRYETASALAADVQLHVIDVDFAGPAGTATIRSAWIIRTGEDVP